MERVTIVGCGNAGLIHAAKLIEKGYEVCLLKTSSAANNSYFDTIIEEGGFQVNDTTSGKKFFAKPYLITRDVEISIQFADVIIVMTTTLQHEDVAKLVSPYLKDGQIVVLCPGYMGSLIFKQYCNKDVTYCEWETTAYNGRIMDGSYVKITFYNPRNAISVMPASRSNDVLGVLSKMFDNTKYLRKNILESALHNPNMIVHTIGMTFSASRIEYSKGEFWMYKEAFTDSVINVIKEFDKQKNKILNAFGCESLDYFEAAKWRNEEDLSIDAMEVFKSFAESSNKGPGFLKHRYILEDVPMGLGLLVSLGKIAGLDTAIAEGIMTLTSALVGCDLKSQSRTISYLIGKPENEISVEDVLNIIE